MANLIDLREDGLDSMIIKKKLNNNVAVAEDGTGHEVIIMGKGLAFERKTGDFVEEAIIDKKFILSDKEFSSKFEEILLQIPMKYVDISDRIIESAKRELGTEINESIYISLTDHIYMAVKRYLDGITVPNPILWDIKRFYSKEFKVGENALKIIRKELKVELPEEEAGFIAFHFVNVQNNFESSKILDILKLVKEITNIVKYQTVLDFDEDSVYYYRFITHLKFFAQRLFLDGGQLTGNRDSLFETVKKQYKKAFVCTRSIVKFVKNKYQYDISEEEQLYLMIHIENIIEKCGNSQDCDN